MPAVSWGPGDKATRASLWARTATSKWVRCCGRCTYWNSYLLGVEIWTLSGQREGERALWGHLENWDHGGPVSLWLGQQLQEAWLLA